jgi:hypothetical protein
MHNNTDIITLILYKVNNPLILKDKGFDYGSFKVRPIILRDLMMAVS